MVTFNAKAGWMEFPRLSAGADLANTYTLAYKVTDDATEKWTSRFIRFKGKDRKAYYGAARLLYHAFPPLFETMGLRNASCAFISALSSSETAADPERQIPYITSQLAETVGTRSAVSALTKQPHNKIHLLYRSEQRDAELGKAQYVCRPLNASNVFVFDDFVTRGSTLCLIARAVLAANPGARVFGVALAKTERINWCPHPDNGHVPRDWDRVWQDGENELA
ncbi:MULTISPECIES: phosphoribosyltransferase [unclassified Aureimonas]|uniref:phosphoribosyltransferase n=1 Tax=unclassified Aureimonas TaxID=2615206 RepID=UPI00070ABA6D|nr:MULTISPECIES: phosphoribosyltransferase [unclassified Aureimonas]KQT58128.1 hypothetical protein ASG62_24750 [Aureimonas sp. Leaf427]KQT65682.1 hypothetical protein ASG54_22645 [Aureimonas sp. Leaf460]